MGGHNISSQAGTTELHSPVGRHLSLLSPNRVFPLLQENSATVLRMVLLVETTRPTVGMTVGHVTLRTIIVIVVECLGGVVHVYSPVSPSVAWNILSLVK